jgi:hypothetical protein
VDVSSPITSVIPSLDGPILQVLASSTAPLSLTKIHQRAGRGSLSGVRKVLLRLVEHGLVHESPAGYALNRDHVAAPAILHLAQLHGEVAARIRSWLEDRPEDVVAASGGLLLAYSVGATLGPILTSSTMAVVGGLGLFLISGLTGLAIAVFISIRMGRRDPTPEAEKEPFQALHGTTTVATELDPRAPETSDTATDTVTETATDTATDTAEDGAMARS